MVEVQNAVKRSEAKLPSEVQRTGIEVRKRTGDLLEMHHSMAEQSLKARLQKEYDDLIETYAALYDYFKEKGRVYSADLLKDVTAIAESSYKYSQFAMVNALENLKNYDLVYVTAKGWTVRDIEYEAMVAKINDIAHTPGKELNLGLGDIDGFIEEYDYDEASDMESQTSVKFRITISGSGATGRWILSKSIGIPLILPQQNGSPIP